MQLYNCYTYYEEELKATDLTKLTSDELKSLLVDISTEYHNGNIESIITTDALTQIAMEFARRSEKNENIHCKHNGLQKDRRV